MSSRRTTSRLGSAVVGSSMTRSRQFCVSARAMAAVWRAPIDRSPRRAFERQLGAQFLQRIGCHLAHFLPFDQTARMRLNDVKGDVFRHAQVGKDREILIDDFDAEMHGLCRRQPAVDTALPHDPAAVG